MTDLSATERRALRARAHHLQPVVAIGTHGLTPAVTHEIDVALNAHELVKIRVHDDDRTTRESLLARVCHELGAAPVQHLGKLLIVYRRAPDSTQDAKARPKTNPAKKKKKVTGTTPRKPRARHTGGKGKPEPARPTGFVAQTRRSTARSTLQRSAPAARSSKSTPRAPHALAPEAPRRRRRAIVLASAHPAGAPNEPPVRRRRKNP